MRSEQVNLLLAEIDLRGGRALVDEDSHLWISLPSDVTLPREVEAAINRHHGELAAAVVAAARCPALIPRAELVDAPAVRRSVLASFPRALRRRAPAVRHPAEAER